MNKYEKYIDIAKEINSGKFDSASALLRKMNKEQKIDKSVSEVGTVGTLQKDFVKHK